MFIFIPDFLFNLFLYRSRKVYILKVFLLKYLIQEGSFPLSFGLLDICFVTYSYALSHLRPAKDVFSFCIFLSKAPFFWLSIFAPFGVACFLVVKPREVLSTEKIVVQVPILFIVAMSSIDNVNCLFKIIYLCLGMTYRFVQHVWWYTREPVVLGLTSIALFIFAIQKNLPSLNLLLFLIIGEATTWNCWCISFSFRFYQFDLVLMLAKFCA